MKTLKIAIILYEAGFVHSKIVENEKGLSLGESEELVKIFEIDLNDDVSEFFKALMQLESAFMPDEDGERPLTELMQDIFNEGFTRGNLHARICREDTYT